MSENAAPPTSCLHVFPSFGIGGVPLRTVRIINYLGHNFRHTIAALDNGYAAAALIAPDIETRLLPTRRKIRNPLHASLAAMRTLRRLRPDLLLTYNWGALEWAIANRLSPVARHLHFEDGFGKEEADRQLWRRVLFRRWALAPAAALVVPSRRLQDVARRVWKLPAEAVTYLPNGVDVERFAAPVRDAIPGFARRPGELVIGTLAPLRPEKNLGRLIRVFVLLGDRPKVRLLVAGDGIEREPLECLAQELGVADRVMFVGQALPEAVLGTFDIFALSSDTEQMPIALLEAMAAGRAVAAVDVGDVKTMVCEENRDFIVPRDDLAAFAHALRLLLRGHAKRAELGQGNRERAAAEYSEQQMFIAHLRLLEGGRADNRTY